MAEITRKWIDGERSGDTEPFNGIRFSFTNATLGIFYRAHARMRGTGGHPDPGSVPNLAALIDQIVGFMLAYKGIQMLNEANRAIFEESKKLACAQVSNYEMFFGTRPYRFIGIGKARDASLLPSDAVIIPVTIQGTNCPQFQLPVSPQEGSDIKKLLKIEIEKHKRNK